MKKTINLRHSYEKKVIKKKGLIKIKKMLPILLPLMSLVALAMIVIFMNGHTLYKIKKIDEALDENQKLAIIFENLDQKNELVNTRKEMIDYLEKKGALAYQVMEELPMDLDNIKVMEVQYRDETIRIIGHCAKQEEIGEFCQHLNGISGLGPSKISQVRNLRTADNLTKKDRDLSWEFILESNIKEGDGDEIAKEE